MLDAIFIIAVIAGFSLLSIFAGWCERQVEK